MNILVNKQKFKNNFLEFSLFILYRLVYDWFSTDMYKVYPYNYGFFVELSDSMSSDGRYLLSWITYLLLVILSIRYLKGYFAVIYKFLLILGGMTTIAIYGSQNITLIDFFKSFTYWIILFFACLYFQNQSEKNIKMIRKKKIKNLQIYLLLFSLIFIIILSGVYSNFRFILSFDEVYSYRLSLRAAKMPGVIGYLMSFVGGAILPYCFAYFLSNKSYFKVGITLFAGILLFSVNGMKTWLIIYFLIIGVYAAYKLDRTKVISFVLLFLIVFMTYGLWIYKVRGDVNSIALIRRVIYIPSQLGYYYITFFDKNEYLYLRESILRHIFQSPYPVSSNFYIVNENTDIINGTRANNGLWGDAYANFAYAGMLIYPFLLIFVMNLIMKLMTGEDERLLVSISFILLWTTLNASFFTWLLTGGVLVIMLVILLSPEAKNSNKKYI
jgi:hypothetical protein